MLPKRSVIKLKGNGIAGIGLPDSHYTQDNRLPSDPFLKAEGKGKVKESKAKGKKGSKKK
ncbi:hypothetical protein [Pontibacter sp. G13]|uniref:hypothetical protein n=1 Tax=Pontibacter sp. G13 TaxID=3074898 RepID=UPI00288A2452|nr:hypothetical protein [Pontibacter sp. G13]WNJ18317.1 hypothetical protein RJD25_25980 [Pontibacter sp. G13]